MPHYYPAIWSGLSTNEHQLGAGEHSRRGGVGSTRQSESGMYLTLHTHKLMHLCKTHGGCVWVRTDTYTNIYTHNSFPWLAASI